MKRSACQLIVVGSLLLGSGEVSPPTALRIVPPLTRGRPLAPLRVGYYVFAATRPRYGGTLRVEMQARVSSLDPARGSATFDECSAAEKIRALLYDRLVRLDASGRPQPALALSWEHDASNTNWKFKLHSAVKWHDGSPLTPFDVARGIGTVVADRHPPRVNGDTLEFETDAPQPDLPILLASDPALALHKENAASPGEVPVGTGPFRLTEWRPGQRVVLQANEDYWGGRPYLDTIQVEMGRSSREQLINLELDKADLVELAPAEARRTQQEGRKVWTSAPVELLSLDFDLGKPHIPETRLRQAIALSIDRSAIQRVLLQNYGEVARGILPQWISGYEFLFSTSMDLGRARQLRAEMGTTPPLGIGYDPADTLAHDVAERIAVNARDVGITLQVSPLPPGGRRLSDNGLDARVGRSRIDAPALAAAFRQAAASLHLLSSARLSGPEEVYAAEQGFLGNFSTVPLVRVPELVGLGSRVKNWSALRWGDWHLDEVWVERN